MITILIRASYRPNGFKKTYDSIISQTFKHWRIICSYDDMRALTYLPEHIEKIRVHKNGYPQGYDFYNNDLKALVNDGYFGFVDEGDVLNSPTVLETLWKHLRNYKGVICQFSREGIVKPNAQLCLSKNLVRGKVGMPCLWLHHSMKDIAHFDGSVGATDYHWIKAVSRKVHLKFVPIVVVNAGKRDYGAMEQEENSR